ncbi:MAG: TonB-dependent receptor [Brevundimonas sp.]|nr:MAG: TonB-dependent receptor [Brevundimonas sp.]
MRHRNSRVRLVTSTILAGIMTAAMPVAAITLLAPGVATAQDYTNGTLTGSVEGADGARIANASISVRSTSQGIVRQATTDANGQFRLPLIPTGGYEVTVEAAGFAGTTENVAVTLGSASDYVFTLASENATELGEVVVTGARRSVDFSRTATGVTVDVEQLVDQAPIARNITAITLLAPGAVPGDSAFAVSSSQLLAPPALGGSSPAENAYFVNGLNTTNFINGLGGAPVPFDFYKTVDVKTGGYSAEFGRAFGGVINAVTKSGTNDFVMEVHGTWAPNALRERTPNTVQSDGGTDPTPGFITSVGESEDRTLTVEMGGPLIRDRLFAYGIASWNDTHSQSGLTNGILRRDEFSKDPFYGVKLDGYITSDHRLEFTYFNTEQTRTRRNYSFDTVTGEIDPTLLGTEVLNQGGDNFVGRYTGTITDWLTVSAAYGEIRVDQAAVNDLFNESRVLDDRPGQDGALLSRQSASSTVLPFLAERKFYRADADLYLNLFGEHHIRLGFDHEDTLLNEVSVTNGGYRINYSTAVAGNTLGLAAGQEYAALRVFESGGGFEGVNEAIYIQDSWDVNDRLNLQIGLRNDTFSVANPLGQTFLDFDGELALRTGFSFDPTGDATQKFYGSYGRYYLPPASNTAFRAAAPATDITEFFLPFGGATTFGGGPGSTTGFDPVTGRPTAGFGPQVTAATGATSLQPCPATARTQAPAGAVACSVRNNGTAPNPDAVAARNVQSAFQDEFIIGYENRITDRWTVGVNAVYRNLGRAVEDALLDNGVIAYCQREGIVGCEALYPGQSLYLIINPGSDVVANVRLPGSTQRQTITMRAEDLGIPKAKREYTALEFTFQRAFDGVWGLQGSYTLSKSEGNYEGGVKSDNGQTDTGITTDFDFLAFIPGSYGLLPNHRGQQLKVFGSWQATDDLMLGGNLSVMSPRHYGCVGLAPNGYADGAVANSSYGSASRFCNGLAVDRGSVFEADWITRFDLSARYSLNDLVPGDLVLRADIFNVFDLQGVTEANEVRETQTGAQSPTYRGPTAYQAPRSIRIGFDWRF